MPEDVRAKRPSQGLDQHFSRWRRIGHLCMDRPCDLFDQRTLEAAIVMEFNRGGIDIEFQERRSRQRQSGKEEVITLGNFSVEVDHVLANTVGTGPDRARNRTSVLQPAVAAPPDMQLALQQDYDLCVADLNLG